MSNQNIFSDFNVPNTSDGSYRGRRKIAEETEKHYDMKFNDKLLEVNQRLKSSKTKVSIEATRGGIQLRATLPLKPGDTSKQGRDKKQYKISLAIPANFDGLKTAEEEAYELGKLIARQTFTWTDKYLGVQATKNKGITFREFYEQFEKRYFEKRKRTIKSENSFRIHQSSFSTYLLSDDVISVTNIIKTIDKIDSDFAKKHAIAVSRIIKNELNLDIDFSQYKLNCKSKKRNIPDDKTILTSINNFEVRYSELPRMNRNLRDSWKLHKLIYGLLATYGLRPREVINNPDLDWFISLKNKRNTFKVHESNKTGYREVLPFVPEWVELFDLKNLEAIKLLKEKAADWSNARELTSKVQWIAATFKVNKIPFRPYDLRHACAIRAHLQGIPIKAAADNLGHTVEIHTKIYQRWFSLENRNKAFEQTFEELSSFDNLKDENAKLRQRNAELELEVARLRLIQQAKS